MSWSKTFNFVKLKVVACDHHCETTAIILRKRFQTFVNIWAEVMGQIISNVIIEIFRAIRPHCKFAFTPFDKVEFNKRILTKMELESRIIDQFLNAFTFSLQS